MSITYKQFENCYTKTVANLQNQWQTEDITYGFIADGEDEISTYNKEYFYIALDGGTVVGYVTCEVRTNDKDNYMNVFPIDAKYLQVYDLYIAPAYRSRSIGAELLTIVEEKDEIRIHDLIAVGCCILLFRIAFIERVVPWMFIPTVLEPFHPGRSCCIIIF